MDVILKENIAHLGKMGDLVKVAPGYARNYLLPRRLAALATPGNLKVAQAQAKKIAARQEGLKEEAEGFKSRMEGASLVFERQIGEDGKLFGSVTAKDVADRLTEMGLVVDKKRVSLSQPLKTAGEHRVTVWLHPEVTAALSVEIVKK